MATIQHPVGKNAGSNGNKPGDVMVIQALLNKFIVPGCMQPFQPLGIDGKCGKITKAAITWFQLNVMGNAFPDGRVDPGGATLAALNGPLKWPSGPPKPLPKPSPDSEPEIEPKSPFDPRRINAASFYKALASPQSVATSWLSLPRISPGETYELSTGNRIVLTGREDGVLYILDTKDQSAGVYLQHPKGFANDVNVDGHIRVGYRSAVFQTMARAEVIFLAGVACGASLPTLVASLSLSAVEFVAEHKKQIPKWVVAVDQVLKARKVLKEHAPTLLGVIEDQVLKTTLAALERGTIHNQDYIAQSIGVTIGIVGAKAWKAKVSVMAVIMSTLTFICGRAFAAAIKTMQYLPAQIEADAGKLFVDFQAGGIQVSRETAVKIAQEVAANPAAIKQTLAELKEAFAACLT